MDQPRASSETVATGQKRKRRQSDDSIFGLDDISVKIEIGEGTKLRSCYVHKRWLCRESAFFRRVLDDTDRLHLTTNPETLESFYNWIYSNSGHLPVKGLDKEYEEGSDNDEDDESHEDSISPSTDDTAIDVKEENCLLDVELESQDPASEASRNSYTGTDRVFGRLLDLYTFSTAYEVPRLQLLVILTWQRFENKHQRMPSIALSKEVINKLAPQAPLCRLLVADFAYYRSYLFLKEAKKELTEFPSWFLAEVLLLTVKIAGDNSPPDEDPDGDWCRFHGHETAAEQDECREVRTDDPDLK